MPLLTHRTGLILVVLCAFGFAASPSLARLAYEGGSIGFALIAFTVAAIVFGAWIILAGALNPPETALGWFGLLGGAIAFVVSVLCFFTALKAVDTVSATLIANLEPILAIAIAYLVLGELLTAPQMIGGAIVIAAILPPSIVGKQPAH